ncbi:glycosyltransferase [Pleomorphomonas sp. JP5]|uniref:glycosyltransferase family protein n=1 Tax=Pleomorphomonas sp. JP5 TaxID=2942998 RepID=UPI002043C675|nr:glycosyltransferase [Pleomorphomonas sp. JP5]MCM5557662.1 hypothetical protein [Pleomorphomonas sp. JP5]
MTPKRILIVANFGRRDLFRRYFNTESKLANGFIRAGHQVLCFSDRDHAREATIFRTQKLGRKRMMAQLLELIGHYRPHLVLFGHCDLIDDAFYERLRAAEPSLKLATFCVDALFRREAMERFANRARHVDAAFITSADREKASRLGIAPGRLFFMPNPVDSGMETARVFDIARQDLTFDGQFLGTGIDKREEQIDSIRQGLPDGYRFAAGGKAFGTQRIDSTEFMQRLADGAVCPNLPLDDKATDQLAYLYSSDRLAQTLGQGVTTLTTAESRLSDLYEDGIVEYRSREDLVSHMIDLYADDDKRRRIGALGHRIAHDRTGASRVADYVLRLSLGETPPDVHWPTGIN